ncbi:ABC transporter ATP-binding protein [Actinoplanes sp. LDG1-06]|uniref:ABC transporter ATP-binding protein n=1 Tax=Paractinoplanes ovalisporus TaxID=2810368 RepID=A0ABS2AKK4_9ACTN|nr:ABC transporter ATP-binding protein [Actinoplanes ovalisporus]MBM2620384.1 ABC transporter ATP-binding protein [Actinoplanes ovalisporus]
MTAAEGRTGGHGSLAWQGIRLLAAAVRAEPACFAGAVAGSALYAGMTIASAWALGNAVDEVLLPAARDGGPAGAALAGLCWLLTAIALLKVLGFVAREYLAGVLHFRVEAAMQRRLIRRYSHLPLAWHQRNPAGDLLSTINADVSTTWQALYLLPSALSAVFMLALGLGDMLATDVSLAVVGFVLFALVLGFSLVYERYAGPLVARAQHLRGDLSAVTHESVDGALVVKALGREDHETRRFAESVDRLRHANVAAGRIRSLYDPVMEALPNIAMLTVLLIGAVRVSSGDARAGDVVHVAYLIAVLAFPVLSIGWILGEFPVNATAYQRVRRVLEADGELTYGPEQAHDGGHATLTADRVGYTYPGADTATLRDVALTLRPGRTVALVGPTGCGKSTLVSLIGRLADPDHGTITLDGQDLRSYARGAVAERISVVPQQTFLFKDTVRGNVALDRPTSDADIWAALHTAQADSFVRDLPDGLDSAVGERGTTLSGGQRQRLAIVRALIRRPGLLVLDDATSAIDPRVEAAILGGLAESAGMTTLVVTHRVATIALADEVVYMEEGRVVATGEHESLLRDCAGYRELITAYQRDREERSGATPSNPASPEFEEVSGR